jgi:hypothetical protein
VGSQPLREVEQSLAAQAEVHHEQDLAAHTTTQAAIAGLQAEVGKMLPPNNELLLLLQGIMPDQIQARHAQTGELIFRENGEPIYLTSPGAKLRQFQRYVRFLLNGIGKLREDAKDEDRRKQLSKEARVEKEYLLLEKLNEACDVDSMGANVLKHKLVDMKKAHRIIEKSLSKRLMYLRADEEAEEEASAPKRLRGATADTPTDDEFEKGASSPPPLQPPPPLQAPPPLQPPPPLQAPPPLQPPQQRPGQGIGSKATTGCHGQRDDGQQAREGCHGQRDDGLQVQGGCHGRHDD